MRPQQAGYRLHQCRFAGAVGADERHDLAGLDRQIDIVNDRRAAVSRRDSATARSIRPHPLHGRHRLRSRAHFAGFPAGVPEATREPASSTITRSATPMTSDMLCSTTMTVTPLLRTARNSDASSAVSASLRPAAGSSSKSIRGRAINARITRGAFALPSADRSPASRRNRARPTMSRRAAACAVSSRSSLRAARQPQHLLHGVAANLVMAADQHILQHRHAGEHARGLERADQAKRGDVAGATGRLSGVP